MGFRILTTRSIMPALPTIQLTMPAPDIALLTFNDPQKGANVLSMAVLAELEAHLNRLEKQPELVGLVIRSGKPGSFIVGADLREFVVALDAPAEQTVAMCHRGRRLFQRLSTVPFVTVAAIDGLCLGGGSELAVWCDRRLMADVPKAQLGFPEIKLGLYPGWGGTARTSRIVGLASAVEMITSGEPVDARSAVLMGLATDRVPAERIQDAAIALIRSERHSLTYLEDRRRWSQPLEVNDTELTFLAATASALIQQQTRGQYPAPPAALEMMLEAASLDIETACVREAEGMSVLFGSPVNRALINVFFLTDRNKKDTGIDGRDVQPLPVRSIGIIGAGIMGRGIAAVNLKRNVSVSITDAAPDALHQGVEKILEEAAYNRQTKRADSERAVHFASLLSATTNCDDLASADLVIEAVVENSDIKRQIFARLEPHLHADAVLASNTSTIPITRLAEGLTHPERFCGIHFFNPVRKMLLVEVIRGKETSDQTIATAVAYAKSIGKTPVAVHDGPGFMVNRLLSPLLTESVELLLDGAEPAAIERAARNFGMPMGPLLLYDMIGLDTAYYAGRVMYEAFPDRTVVSPVVGTLIKAGRKGQKTGAGFFSYSRDPERGEPDPKLGEIIAPFLRPPTKFTAEQITARLFLPMLLEATRELSDGIVHDPRDIDLALIHGLGFPPFKGGLLFWAQNLGLARILEMLKPLASLGRRMEPTPLLLEMAKSNKPFYRPGP
jgi:3-hydroxyacyl-CoA dehydrogenase/enoyl-CoA hydratase/carnithine racemase